MVEDVCETEEGFPSQLMSAHQCQEDQKVLRYHPALEFIVSIERVQRVQASGRR
jgi:hypothetical protein